MKNIISLCFAICMLISLLACSPISDGENQPDISTKLLIKSEVVKSMVLVSNDSLRIERTGNETTIFDIAGGRTHKLTTKKIARRKTAPQPVSNLLISTDTLMVSQLRGVLLITEKSTNTNYLI